MKPERSCPVFAVRSFGPLYIVACQLAEAHPGHCLTLERYALTLDPLPVECRLHKRPEWWFWWPFSQAQRPQSHDERAAMILVCQAIGFEAKDGGLSARSAACMRRCAFHRARSLGYGTAAARRKARATGRDRATLAMLAHTALLHAY